jgi:chlorophyll synthase
MTSSLTPAPAAHAPDCQPDVTPSRVSLAEQVARRYPEPRAILTLLKPVTWFPPMWAFGCGLVASGVALGTHVGLLLLGALVTGPLVCGASQAVNDWFDRHVDAINEPNRPIPSGRIPGRWGLAIAIGWSALAALAGWQLGPFGAAATGVGLILAWAYSAPPFRLKLNGWWGNLAVGLSYEGLAWVTGHAVALGGATPPGRSLLLALCYSLGGHGIMTLNDFKAIEGDRVLGVRSLPVQLGPERAARFACLVMLVFQVAALLIAAPVVPVWAIALHATLIAAQLPLMRRLLTDPRALAPWYNATGILLYVLGMLVSAFGLRAGASL